MKIFSRLFLPLFLAFVSVGVTAQEKNYDDSLSTVADSVFADTVYTDLKPYPQRAIARLDSLMHNRMFETSQVGVMVYDLDADSVLFRHNERQLMRPASTMKLLTAIAALDLLGADYRFATTVYYSGERDSTTLNGNIYVKGGMDPSLQDYDLNSIVEEIVRLGVDTIRGSIIGDRSFKDADVMGEGWCWDDDNPILSPLVFRRKDNLTSVLMQKLIAQGITVTGSCDTGKTPSDAILLTVRYSPMGPVLTKMMKESDNLYAEAVLYQLGALSGATSTAKRAQQEQRRVMQRAGLDASRYRLADGSGLSLYNYLSAESEVKLLQYAYRNKNIFGALCQSLPVSGTDGTLKRRMRSGAAYGKVYAKTGTLSGIYTLAGYCVSPDNHMLAFCIFNQGVMHSKNARMFQDQVCEALCR